MGAKRMAWRKTDPNEWNASAFRVIGREWLLLVTEGERPNAMTASWGGFGMLWNRPVVLLWVRPERHSYGLLTQNERFSVCVLPERYREAYRICGSMSGRETDKIARSGLTVQRVNGVACIRESRAVLLCRRQYTQAMIPQGYAAPALLEEVLALAVDGRWIYVEVKPGPEIVPHIRDVFAKQTRATPQNTLFISFSKGSCAALKRLMPGYKVFWLTGARRGRKGEAQSPITPAFVLDALRETGADGVDCQFDPDVVTADFVQAIRGAGFEFHVWTVDRLDLSLLAFARGAQTVTTNCAQRQLDAWRARRRK